MKKIQRRVARLLHLVALCSAFIVTSQAFSFAMPPEHHPEARYLRHHAFLLGLIGVAIFSLSMLLFFLPLYDHRTLYDPHDEVPPAAPSDTRSGESPREPGSA